MNFFKKSEELNKYVKYCTKEKSNLAAFVGTFYAAPFMFISVSIFYDIFCCFNINQMFFNMCLLLFLILPTSFIVPNLIYITLLKIENYRQKHKDSHFDKFLNKVEKFESFLKAENVTKGIILHVFRLLTIFFILIIFNTISGGISIITSINNYIKLYIGAGIGDKFANIGFIYIGAFFSMFLFIILIYSIIDFIEDLGTLIKEKMKKSHELTEI